MMEKDSCWSWIGRDSSGKPQWRDQSHTLTGFCGQVQGAACVSPGSSKNERCSYAEWRQKLCPRRRTLGIWTSYSLLGFASSGCSIQQKCHPGRGGTGRRWKERFSICRVWREKEQVEGYLNKGWWERSVTVDNRAKKVTADLFFSRVLVPKLWMPVTLCLGNLVS